MAQPTPVWFITGCSTGFGRALVERVLARGWRVVATARNPASLSNLDADPERLLVLPLDVTDERQIAAAVGNAKGAFGRIDVLVNNAGYGYLAAIEEGEDAPVRAMFDTNVFGLIAVTKAVLPIMRAQKSGHILNLSSIGGLASFPATGYYHATKFAVEGLSGSLAQEVAPLGIKVTLIEPGPFRTDFIGRSIAQSPNRIPDYDATSGVRRDDAVARNGRQAGDPVRAAEAMIAMTETPEPPLHLLLGRRAVLAARADLELKQREFAAWEATALGADFPDAG